MLRSDFNIVLVVCRCARIVLICIAIVKLLNQWMTEEKHVLAIVRIITILCLLKLLRFLLNSRRQLLFQVIRRALAVRCFKLIIDYAGMSKRLQCKQKTK